MEDKDYVEEFCDELRKEYYLCDLNFPRQDYIAMSAMTVNITVENPLEYFILNRFRHEYTLLGFKDNLRKGLSHELVARMWKALMHRFYKSLRPLSRYQHLDEMGIENLIVYEYRKIKKPEQKTIW